MRDFHVVVNSAGVVLSAFENKNRATAESVARREWLDTGHAVRLATFSASVMPEVGSRPPQVQNLVGFCGVRAGTTWLRIDG